MFEELICKYDNLIVESDKMPVRQIIERLKVLNKERLLCCMTLLIDNRVNIYQRSKNEIIDYVGKFKELKHDDGEFFNDIERIKQQVADTLTQEFCVDYEQRLEMLKSKERFVCDILKNRLSKKPVKIGKTRWGDKANKDVTWMPYEIDLRNNRLYVISKGAILPSIFQMSGYTDIEDGAEIYGCARLSCRYCASYIREEMNTWLFNRLFDDDEKAIITDTIRTVNTTNSLINSDISSDKLFLLSKQEFERLDPCLKSCLPSLNFDSWWLCEQKSYGWDDTEERPTIYTVGCMTEKIDSQIASKPSLVRPAMALDLDRFIEMYVI